MSPTMSATACGDMPAAVISFLRLVDCGFGCRYAGAGDTDQKRDVGCTTAASGMIQPAWLTPSKPICA